MIGIYKITSPSGKIYIGQSVNIERRFKDYKNFRSGKNQIRLNNSFKKYGVINHIFEIIEECEFEELNNRERYWQETYNVINENGLNCLFVNTDELPKVHSSETKEKMSKAQKGKLVSEETKIKLSENNAKFWKGKKLSEKHKLKMSNSKKGVSFFEGKKHTEETKLKMSKQKMKKVIDTENGNIYESAKEVSKLFNLKYNTLLLYLVNKIKNKTRFKYLVDNK